MDQNLTEVICILDASGSMNHLADDVVGGYNAFIDQQKEDKGQTKVTLVTFDQDIQTRYENIDVNEVKSLTKADYMMGGCTSLLDAIGITLTTVGKRLAATPEEQRPSKVIVMINTDGAENSSKEYTRKQIKEMVKEQTDKYSWQFLFSGANIDSVTEAESLGISKDFAVNYSYDSSGVDSVYRSLSVVTTMMKNNASVEELSSCYKSTIK